MIIRVLITLLILSPSMHSQKKFNLECSADLLAKSRMILTRQVGIIEHGKNAGRMISNYLASVGLSQGSPYCAAGQYWCFAEACSLQNLSQENIPIPKTGLANGFYIHAKRNGKQAKFNPKIDDLIVWRYPKSIHGHVERIISIGRGGWVETIGFNTVKKINAKSVEGVFRQRRNIYHPLRRMYVRGLVGFYTGADYDS